MSKLDFWRGTFNPYREVMDRFFDDFASFPTRTLRKDAVFAPTCEVSEDKNAYLLKFDLPGLSKDQVKIELHDNQLTVSGERKEEKKEEGRRYHFSETTYGSFMRTFNLPANTDPEKVEARFENGVLSVSVAKNEPAKARQVNIK